MEEDIKNTRLKLYMGSLFPIDPNVFKYIDANKIDSTRNQVYIYKEDIHREIFCQILLEIGRNKGRKPVFSNVTLNELIEHHFDPQHPSTNKYIRPDVLFVSCITAPLENKIYGPVLDKVVEERRASGKPTFVFYKGDIVRWRNLKITSLNDVVDFNGTRNSNRKEEIL